MNKTVTLPKKVAVAIENLREKSYTNRGIIRFAIRNDIPTDYGTHLDVHEICEFGKVNFNTLLDALVNGYEVEKTPEERIKVLYEKLGPSIGKATSESRFDRAMQLGIERTLDLLDIKIPGVN